MKTEKLSRIISYEIYFRRAASLHSILRVDEVHVFSRSGIPYALSTRQNCCARQRDIFDTRMTKIQHEDFFEDRFRKIGMRLPQGKQKTMHNILVALTLKNERVETDLIVHRFRSVSHTAIHAEVQKL